MSKIDQRIADLGLVLPEPLILPTGVVLPFPNVHIQGSRAFISGHGPQDADGSLAFPKGQVGTDVTLDEAKILAQKTGLGILRSLRDELGDLDRVIGWSRVFGMVNSAPGFANQPEVINGFTHLILELFGENIGRHARSAVGMAALPMGIAVEIEAEVMIAP